MAERGRSSISNALLSSRVYLQQDEAAGFRYSYDHRVSGSSSPGDFGRRLNYVVGEGYFTQNFQNQRNLRRCIAHPPPAICPARENAEKFDQPSCLNGEDDDELEEGELTPSPRRSSSFAIANSSLTENDDDLEEGQFAPSPRRSSSFSKFNVPLESENDDYLDHKLFFSGNCMENSCAADALPRSRINLKRSRDFATVQPKYRMKDRERESHVIVVCGQGSQRRKNIQRNTNSNTHKDNEEIDGRQAGLTFSCGLDSGKATLSRILCSKLDELGKLNTISAPKNMGCVALKELYPLQQKGSLGKYNSIACWKDGSEIPGRSLLTHQVDQGSKVADNCKQQYDLSAYSEASVAAQNFLRSNCENGRAFKENVGGCSGADKEIENRLRDKNLDSEAPFCIKFSGSYPSNRFNFENSSCKKLKSGYDSNLKTNFTHESSTPGSNFAVVNIKKLMWQNSSLRSEVQHNLSAPRSINVHRGNDASHNSCRAQIPLKPSTSSSQIRPNMASGLFKRFKPWTWTRRGNMVETPAKAPNATSLTVKEPCIGTRSQPTAYVLKGNSLLRVAEPTMSFSGRLTPVQQYHTESSYTGNPSTTSNAAKTVPSTLNNVASNLDMSKFSTESSFPPAASCIPYDTTLNVTRTGSATSLTEAAICEITEKAGVPHSRLSDSDAVDITGIPDSYILRAKRNQSGKLMSNSKSGMIDRLKGKSNQTLSAPTCNEDSVCFMDECSRLELASHGHDHNHEMNSHQFFQRIKLKDQKTVASLQVLKESGLPKSLKEQTLKTQQNHTNSARKLHRVLKQKRLATLLSIQGPTLDSGHPQSPSLTQFQMNKIVTSLLPWKRPVYIPPHSRRIKYASKVSKGLLHILARKLQCLQNTEPLYSRSVDGLSLHRSAATSLGGSNLNWKNLIDKHSEKDDEEDNMTVPAEEKGKREDKDNISQDVAVNAKEQTKRLVAYEGSSCNSDTLHTSCATTTPRISTSRRLSNSGIKYMQVCNGKQLFRGSNTISHALAGQKIRRSLHTVRSILSKKQQNSQSLSRFGNSNKEVGKYPGTHDFEKVAIRAQFLKDTCPNMDCRLTPMVISESMPDCSNLLLGVCTDESCPYRHVNVNPKAPICDGFLKGFCPDSDKCQKKHTYICPQYASTRNCSKRSICKFHQRKPKLLVRMLKRTSKDREHYIVPFKERGYIRCSSSLMNTSGKENTGVKGASMEDETADYISLSTSEEDASEDQLTGDNILQKVKAFPFGLRMETNDPDLMFKPLLLLRRQV